MDNAVQSKNPLAAPIWRKLLAVRVLALGALSLALTAWLGDLMETLKLDLPRWLFLILLLPGLAAVFGFYFGLVAGLTDLAVHFLPSGRVRGLLLRGDRTPEQLSAEFADGAYLYALMPAFVLAGMLLIAVVCLLVLGGVAALSGAFAMVSGWPSWAIVIAVLLVLLLLKK